MLFSLGISMSMLKSSGFASRTGICLLFGRVGDGVGLVCSKGGLSSSFPTVPSLLSALPSACLMAEGRRGLEVCCSGPVGVRPVEVVCSAASGSVWFLLVVL